LDLKPLNEGIGQKAGGDRLSLAPGQSPFDIIKDRSVNAFLRAEFALQEELHGLPGRSAHIVRDPGFVTHFDRPVELLSQGFSNGIFLDDRVEEGTGGDFFDLPGRKGGVNGVNIDRSHRIHRYIQIVDDSALDLLAPGISNFGLQSDLYAVSHFFTSFRFISL
jgi:hypothetical protein